VKSFLLSSVNIASRKPAPAARFMPAIQYPFGDSSLPPSYRIIKSPQRRSQALFARKLAHSKEPSIF
jgi:hypothetical protein